MYVGECVLVWMSLTWNEMSCPPEYSGESQTRTAEWWSISTTPRASGGEGTAAGGSRGCDVRGRGGCNVGGRVGVM